MELAIARSCTACCVDIVEAFFWYWCCGWRRPWKVSPAGFQHYVVIKNLAPGVRFRRPLTSRADNDVDLSEAEARWLYETTLTERAREIEAHLRKAAEARK